MKKSQLGNIQVMLIVGAVVATIIVGLLWERSSLTKENKELNSAVTVSNKDRDTALEANKTLKTDLETERKLKEASLGQAVDRQRTIDQQQKTIDGMNKKLPKPVSKVGEPAEDAASVDRAVQRSRVLWEVYCLESSDTVCVKEPVQ